MRPSLLRLFLLWHCVVDGVVAEELYCGDDDCYKILGVAQDASEGEIRRAYRRLAVKLHPDKNREVEESLANEQFQQLAKAYEVLSSPQLREAYDYYLAHPNEQLYNRYRFYQARYQPKLPLLHLIVGLLLFITAIQYINAWTLLMEEKAEAAAEERAKAEEEQARHRAEERLRLRQAGRERKMREQQLRQEAIEQRTKEKAEAERERLQQKAAERVAYLEGRERLAEKLKMVDANAYREVLSRMDREEVLHYSSISADQAFVDLIQEKLKGEEEEEDDSAEWSEEELAKLTKALTKYPGGTRDRWMKIREFLGTKTEKDIIAKADELKSRLYSRKR
ncbi:hypothetical protein FOZ61_003743 [Perkinsus olseni]|uniref:J domain-containing protein n=1 Tax=Perkinsus olseni TaxID=32597 RepID=A0A7J6M456_PEROL|nr:hypothetical protein FOZ61_003743 [Perkinsus olseni]KAF4665871.1 hypothetical protein FOL46_003418 [Perkinsus olseni]